MSAEDAEPAGGQSEQPASRLGRRGFLWGLGAGALATAAVVFGAARGATAAPNTGCCVWHGGSGTFEQCAARPGRYIWRCQIKTPWGTCVEARECCDADRKPYGDGYVYSANRMINCY
jgi:hypothetical protein